MSEKAFKFRAKTLRLPWSDQAAAFFRPESDDIAPASYTVTVHLKTLVFECKCKTPGGWTHVYRRRAGNVLNLAVSEVS